MKIRKSYIESLVNRSVKKLADDAVIFCRFSSSENAGWMNAAKLNSIQPLVIENCDIKLKKKKNESSAGAEIDADVVILILKSNMTFDVNELDERDYINIGGTVTGNTVTGGTDYIIENYADYDYSVKFSCMEKK